jgi:hypothetical protein
MRHHERWIGIDLEGGYRGLCNVIVQVYREVRNDSVKTVCRPAEIRIGHLRITIST